MNDEEAILYLSELRQIGRWSAEMILLFTFNRSNIWPLQDIGLLRAISEASLWFMRMASAESKNARHAE